MPYYISPPENRTCDECKRVFKYSNDVRVYQGGHRLCKECAAKWRARGLFTRGVVTHENREKMSEAAKTEHREILRARRKAEHSQREVQEQRRRVIETGEDI